MLDNNNSSSSSNSHTGSCTAMEVGSPLLGVRDELELESCWVDDVASDDDGVFTAAALPSSTTRHQPIVLAQHNMILFPQSHHITVRAWETGHWLGDLGTHVGSETLPRNKNERDDKDDTTTAKTRRQQTRVSCCTTTADGRTIYVGGSNGKLYMYDMRQVVQTLQAHPRSVVNPTAIVSYHDTDKGGGKQQHKHQLYPFRWISCPQSTDATMDTCATRRDDSRTPTTTILYALQQTKAKKVKSLGWRVELQLVQLSIRSPTATAPTTSTTSTSSQKDVPTLRRNVIDTLVYYHHHHHDNNNNNNSNTTTTTTTPQAQRQAKSKQERMNRTTRSKIVDLQVRNVSHTDASHNQQQHFIIVTRQATLQMYRVDVTDRGTKHKLSANNNNYNSSTSTLWHPFAKKTKTSTTATSATMSKTSVTCVAFDQDALALGFASGEIRVWPRFISTLGEHVSAQSKGPTAATTMPALVYRSLHWHAHPVATLVYDDGGTLYSGGVEAVMCTWPMTGTSADHPKPTQVLPRLARAALTQLCAAEGRMLITAADETGQLVWLHNQARVWHIQACPVGSGGAAGTRLTAAQVPSVRMLPHVPMHASSKSHSPNQQDTLLLSGLPTTAGQVTWYSPVSQQVTQELVVTPFNTISRTTASDKPWPPPMVTQVATAHSVLVTVDVVPTENIQAGQAVALDTHNTVGSLTTLKFWRWNNENSSSSTSRPNKNDTNTAAGAMASKQRPFYTCTAIVPSPHGPASAIDELALSPSGRFCCTVSCGEDKSFRIWQHMAMDPKGRSSEYAWVCRYRVAFPSGYANQNVSAVAFSSDDSVLAMAFGTVTTLWDVRSGSLLNSLHHVGTSAISRLCFLPSGPYQDALVSFSTAGLVLQSPFGMQGPANVGWTWELPHTESQMLSDMLIFDSTTIVAALFDKTLARTNLLVVDVASGRIRLEVIFPQPTRVIAMAKSFRSDNSIYVMTLQETLHRVSLSDSMEPFLMAFDDKVEAAEMTRFHTNQRRIGDAPTVSVLVDNMAIASRKRRPTAVVLTIDNNALQGSDPKRIRTRLLLTDDSDANYIPRLRGAITLSFLGRHLRKKG